MRLVAADWTKRLRERRRAVCSLNAIPGGCCIIIYEIQRVFVRKEIKVTGRETRRPIKHMTKE